MNTPTFIRAESQADHTLPPLKPGERFLSVNDIALLTGRGCESVRRWLRCKRHPLKSYRPGGSGAYLVHPDHLAEFLNKPRSVEISPRLSRKLDDAAAITHRERRLL